MSTTNRKTVSLVLGSGGARGLAHIGVIHWLKESDFQIKSNRRLLDLSWEKRGLVRGEKLVNTLIGLVGEKLIEDLPISYTAVATDLRDQKEVWIRSGSLLHSDHLVHTQHGASSPPKVPPNSGKPRFSRV